MPATSVRAAKWTLKTAEAEIRLREPEVIVHAQPANVPRNFQQFILALLGYWEKQGCLLSQPYDASMGAGTFHPHTFLRGIGPEPWRAAYVQPCRRPADGRFGKSPYRFQHYYQMQIILKPAPPDIVDVFLRSLEAVGIRLKEHEFSLLEDDWKGPTLGAWGLGWEVRANGQEVTQFTYFQQLGGLDVDVVSGEITYGLERLYMYASGLKDGRDIPFSDQFTYGDIYNQNEFEFSHFNFHQADAKELFRQFDRAEAEVARLCELAQPLVLPAYDYVLEASHLFNLLDARGAISVNERQRYIGRVRDCARRCAVAYRKIREELGFPLTARSLPWSKADAAATAVARDAAVAKILAAKPGTREDFVVELGAEEMPAKFLSDALPILEHRFTDWLAKQAGSEQSAGDPARAAFSGRLQEILAKKEFSVFSTPRRLSLYVPSLPLAEPARLEALWGPAKRVAAGADGALSQAGLGFCRKQGVAPEAVLWKSKPGDASEFLYAEKAIPGRPFGLALAEQFYEWAKELNAPLKMKWIPDEPQTVFIRPVRWLAALHGATVLPVCAFGLVAEGRTFGQRILYPDALPLRHAQDYKPSLSECGVVPEASVRRALILEQCQALAAEVGGTLVEDEELLEELVGRCERPHAFRGKISDAHMRLPGRLVLSVLKEHMKYFGLRKPDGSLLPFSLGVAGYRCGAWEEMISHAENVLSGRLDDGAFYYDADLATPLDAFRERLGTQLFQAGMGTLLEKSERLETLAALLLAQEREHAASSGLGGTVPDPEIVQGACRYLKADLRSGCVQEFPDDMQGVMGGVLARHQWSGKSGVEAIACAIEDQYLPAGQAGALPRSPEGRFVALTDRLDSLILMMAHGEELKGNKDPFGLRRLGLGVLRLLGALGDQVDPPVSRRTLRALVSSAAKAVLDEAGRSGQKPKLGCDEVCEKVLDFLVGRLKPMWRSEFDPGAVEAVCARLSAWSVAEARRFVSCLDAALKPGPGGSASPLQQALEAYKRSRNITSRTPDAQVPQAESAWKADPSRFTNDAERHLLDAARKIGGDGGEAMRAYHGRDYPLLLARLSALAGPLEALFTAVMVQDPDPQVRANREGLLLAIRGIYERFADFSLIQES